MSHIELGKFNRLRVVKEVDFGLYLDGYEDGEILLPSRYVPEGIAPDDYLDVFIYLDIDERLIATTLTPLAQVGQFAYLEVAWVNQYGAFLNWGLMKDLFVPFREQKQKMEKGRRYMVYVHIDEESYRIMATAKIEKHLNKTSPSYRKGDEVNIQIWQKTELGYKAIIEHSHSGMLYANEIFRTLTPGMQMTAYIKQIRPDGKIDLQLQRDGIQHTTDFSTTLLAYIREHDGRIALHDKSDAETIYETFGVSKKTFKKAVGDLYKKRQIVLEEDGIKLA